MTKNYVVTGTSRGIGLEMTKQLLGAGHHVHALARAPQNSKELMRLKERYPQQLSVLAVDVTSDEQVSKFAKEYGAQNPIDVLINNAGVYGEASDFEGLSLETLAQTITTNAVAPMRVTRALLPYLKKSSNPRVIHITSLMGSIADNTSGGSYGYRMSKAALNMFSKSFSADFPNIVSVVVHPGWVKTDMGGENAPLEAADSARGILKLAAQATEKDSGHFFDYEGDELPW